MKQKKKAKRKPGRPPEAPLKLPTYGSMAACSNETGIPTSVQQFAKKQNCEAFRYYRVDLKLLLKWLFGKLDAPRLLAILGGDLQQDLPLPSGSDQRVGGRAALDEFKAQREKIRLQRDMEELVSKEDVRAGTQQALAELFGTLERVLCNEMPPTLVGMRELEVRKRVKAELDSCKDQLRKRFAELEASTSGSSPSAITPGS